MHHKFVNWHKSRRSDGTSNCVEVAFATDGDIGVRDSKERGRGPVLEFTRNEWAVFVATVRDGQFDQR